MKRLLLMFVALVALATPAAAQSGINLAWDDCGGVSNKNFACASNTATASKITGSYVAPAGVNQMSGNETVIDFSSQLATLPAWWNVRGTGQCRNGALTANVGTPGTCAQDFWAGNGAGGIGAYNVGFSGSANRARLVMAFAVPADFIGPVADGIETYAFTLQISNTKTVGTGSCADCAAPVCIVFNSIKLTQPVGIGDFILGNPVSGTSNQISWNSVGGDCVPVPTKNRTWGAVKALYR